MKEIVRYILETVVCSGILYGAYLLFLRNCTGYLAARLCLTGSLLAAALIPLLRIPVWPGKVIYATAGTPAKTTFTAPSVSAAAFDYEAAIWIVYGCGVLLLLSSMFRQALLIRRLRRHSTQERIGRIVLVRPTAQIASFSFFRTIYISRSVAEKDIAAIFAHGKMRRRHLAHRQHRRLLVLDLDGSRGATDRQSVALLDRQRSHAGDPEDTGTPDKAHHYLEQLKITAIWKHWILLCLSDWC